MADNPMFAKFDQALGVTTPTGSGSGSSRADQIRALAKQSTPAAAPTPAVEKIGTDLSTRGQNITKAAGDIGSEVDTASKDIGTVPAVALGAAKLGGRVAGEVAGGAGDIIGEVVSAATPPWLKDWASKAVTSAADTSIGHATVKGAIDAYHAIPESVRPNVDALVNTLGLLGGGKAASTIGPTIAEKGAALAEKAGSGVDKAVEAVKSKAAEGAGQDVLDALRPTEETMTPTMKKEAIAEGRQTIKNTKLGGTVVDYTPTPEIKRASELLQDKNILPNPVTAKDAPNVILAKTNSAISRLGGDAEKYLESNPVKITNEEDAKMFSGMVQNAEKSSTKTELDAYKEQIQLFQKQLQGRSGGYTTANYYKALKAYEENVAAKLPRGKDALIDPTGVANAKVQAAADIRKAVRDMIGSKHKDFQPKMYDLASLYEARDAAIQNASKVKSESAFDKHPLVKDIVKKGAITAGGTIVGGGILKEAGVF